MDKPILSLSLCVGIGAKEGVDIISEATDSSWLTNE